jgi:hypothetical protein
VPSRTDGPADDQAHRDRPDPGPARAHLLGELLPDDPPLDDRDPVGCTRRRVVVGEAYAGDEDADLLEIDRIIREEIAPRLIGEDVFAVGFDVSSSTLASCFAATSFRG